MKTKLDREGHTCWTKWAQAESHRRGHPCYSGPKLVLYRNPWVPFIRPREHKSCMPQWLGMPPRPPCQRPLHTSCDPTTILQVYPSSKQSTQPYSPASPERSLSNAQQKGVYLGHRYFLSPPVNPIPPRLISWGPCKASTWPGPAGASHISSPTSLQRSTPCLKSLPL